MMLAVAGEPFWMNPTFWVGVAFAILLGLMLRAKVLAMITKALDDRAVAIKTEIDEARRLREEAEKLLADYQKKHADAENEAKAIIDNARREAEALAAETRRSLKEGLERRTKVAEDKIARAEAQAVGEVRGDGGRCRHGRGRTHAGRARPAIAGCIADRPEHPGPQGPPELRPPELRPLS